MPRCLFLSGVFVRRKSNIVPVARQSVLAGYFREVDIFMIDPVRMRLTGTCALAMSAWALLACALQH